MYVTIPIAAFSFPDLSRQRQELFVDYGRWYWASLRPKQLAVKHAAEARRFRL